MIDDFAARARDAGAEVHSVSSADLVAERVAGILRERGAKLVTLSSDLGELDTPVREALVSSGLEFVEEGAPATAVEKADAGISGAALGVAETGSILIEGNDLSSRLATMLPIVHITILKEDCVVPSLLEVGEHLRLSALGHQGERIRYASLVTGPSRTADVEKTLSTGVHGPGELHILLVSNG